MTELNWAEWIGYVGSVLIAVSLTMTSIVRLRWFNLAGSFVFTGYALLIGAVPVVVVNLLIIGVNVFYLSRIYAQEDYFKTLEIKPNSQFLGAFLDFYSEAIQKAYPGFTPPEGDENLVFLTLRNMAVAGVLIMKREIGPTLRIELDYAIPQYADFKVGRYVLIENQNLFLDKGYDRLEIDLKNLDYERYFLKMGFRDSNEANKTLLFKMLA